MSSYYFCPHCHEEQISCVINTNGLRWDRRAGKIQGKVRYFGRLRCESCRFEWHEISTYTPGNYVPKIDRELLHNSIHFAFSIL